MLERRYLVLLALGTSLSFWDIFNVPYIVDYASKIFNVNTDLSSLPLSAEMLGYFIGGSFNGYIASKWGRKKGLILSMGLISLGSVIGLLSLSFIMIIISEFIIGMGIEGEVATVPSYISEMVENRGKTIGIVESFGFLMSLVVGPIAVLAGQEYWKLLFLAGVTIAIPSLFFRFYLPESKLWIKKSNEKFKWDNTILLFLIAWFFSYFAGYALFSDPIFSLIGNKGFNNTAVYFTYILYGDPLGVLIASIVNDKIERKLTSFLTNFLSGVLIISWPFLSGISFLGIGFTIMFLQGFKFPVMYTYTAENITTKIRTLGFGIADGIGHLGGVIGPIILSLYYQQDVILAFTIVGLTAIISGSILGIFGLKTKGLSLEKIKG
ncbi:MFS transporter [Acidianus brierleyi]|uniref:MFS transporter n=1 Tax=Acidianus brierleyi TaxID=41673 RepID=A0A2U9IC47_9CREN|nr:MFS transporter [Acidianus brierleyi]AWR93596.1 MFS transporter [Acidianus brierleyi]